MSNVLPNQKNRNSIVEMIVDDYCLASISGVLSDDHPIVDWLPSDTFSLIRLSADELAAPSLPHTPAELKYFPVGMQEKIVGMHIVVDKNIHDAGATPNMNFIPNIIVVAGAPAFHQIIRMGHNLVIAYVGDLVKEELT